MKKYVIQNDASLESVYHKIMECLKQNNYTVSPWSSRDFWLAVRDKYFSKIFFSDLIQRLENDIGDKKNSTPSNKAVKSIIFTIGLLTVSFGRPFDQNYWGNLYALIGGLSDEKIGVEYLKEIQGNLENEPLGLQEIIPRISSNYKTGQLRYSLPLYNLAILNIFIHNDILGSRFTAYTCAQLVFDDEKETNSLLILFHLINYIMVTFPTLDISKLNKFVELFLNLIGSEYPISYLAEIFGKKIEQEIKFKTNAYFHALKDALESVNSVGYIPLLFDQCNKFFPNIMYCDMPTDSLYTSVVKYVRYLVRDVFNSSKNLSIEECFEIFTNLDTEVDIEQMKAKFQNQEDTKDNGPINGQLQPFIFPTKLIKLNVDFKPNQSFTTDFEDNKMLYNSPTNALIYSSLLKLYAEAHKDSDDIAEEKICICGNDNFVSSFLNALIYANTIDPILSKNVKFILYFIHTKFESKNQKSYISDFLSEIDPVYDRFVSHLYNTTSLILPTLNEDSKFSLPFIQTKNEQFDNHIYFSDPSPDHLFMFGIQHYLNFAKYNVIVKVWKCEIELIDSENIMVIPFITSLLFGSQFTNKYTYELENDIPSKVKIANITYNVLQNEESQVKLISKKVSSFSLNNYDKVTGVKPTDDYLLFQRVKKAIPLDGSERSNIIQTIVSSFEFELLKNEPFKVMIDNNVYSNVKKIKVSKMLDPSNKNIDLRFATFLPNCSNSS